SATAPSFSFLSFRWKTALGDVASGGFPAEGEKGERRNGKVPCGHNTTPHMAKLSNQPIGRTGIIIDVYTPDGANSIGQTDGHSTSARASMM
ncbi:hypothetical protein, partial [Bifidobacterium longum]|uniref:hypothetical protein n=2 Tax=Bifidobacterium longum TaxID=216816 RepID=UPI001C62E5C1